MLDRDRVCLALAQKGLLSHPETKEAENCVDTSGDRDKLDDTLRKAVGRERALTRVWRTTISESEGFVPNGEQPSVDSAQLDAAKLSFGDKPLIVLTRGNLEGAPGVPPVSVAAVEAVWKAGHDRIAALFSTRGISAVVPAAGHFIQVDQPGAVIEGIRRVVMDVRHG